MFVRRGAFRLRLFGWEVMADPVDLAQRVLVARARAGADEFELAERVVQLVEELRRTDRPAAVVSSLSMSPSRRRLAESARELLVAEPAFGGLDRVSRMLGVSRSHLSRVFRAQTGETLTRFRNRVRVRAALDRIEGGERSLARLATDLGFADQAHLTGRSGPRWAARQPGSGGCWPDEGGHKSSSQPWKSGGHSYP